MNHDVCKYITVICNGISTKDHCSRRRLGWATHGRDVGPGVEEPRTKDLGHSRGTPRPLTGLHPRPEPGNAAQFAHCGVFCMLSRPTEVFQAVEGWQSKVKPGVSLSPPPCHTWPGAPLAFWCQGRMGVRQSLAEMRGRALRRSPVGERAALPPLPTAEAGRWSPNVLSSFLG